MTLVCGIKQRKAAYLYADTAYVDPSSGIVRGFGTKIFAGQQFPWAMAITAEISVESAKALDTLNPRNVVGLCRDLPEAVEAFSEASAKAGLPNAGIRILAACWDARKAAPRLFVIGNSAGGVDEFASPGELVEMDSFFGTEDADLPEVWDGGSPNDPAAFDPVAHPIAIYDRLRERPYSFAGRMGHWIGGELERLTVTRRGVQLEALRTWDDEVGNSIDARPRAIAA